MKKHNLFEILSPLLMLPVGQPTTANGKSGFSDVETFTSFIWDLPIMESYSTDRKAL